MIVRHFSAEGKELGAYLPRSSFPPGLEPGGPSVPVRIMVSKDRVGVLAFSGNLGFKTEWLELDLRGNVVERSRLDNRQIFAAAFTADDHIYLGGDKELYTLDHSSHMWRPTPKLKGSLMGADGLKLVYSVGSPRGAIELQCFDQPGIPGTDP
jgi:hypothetical protein